MTPYWIAGKECSDGKPLIVRSPYDGRDVGTTAHVRATALLHVSTTLAARSDAVAEVISVESGKPMRWARGEVARAVSTFRWAAQEARRWIKETMGFILPVVIGSKR